MPTTSGSLRLGKADVQPHLCPWMFLELVDIPLAGISLRLSRVMIQVHLVYWNVTCTIHCFLHCNYFLGVIACFFRLSFALPCSAEKLPEGIAELFPRRTVMSTSHSDIIVIYEFQTKENKGLDVAKSMCLGYEADLMVDNSFPVHVVSRLVMCSSVKMWATCWCYSTNGCVRCVSKC